MCKLMNIPTKILLLTSLLFSSMSFATAEEPSSFSDRLSYNESIDPTTVFLYTGSDFAKTEQMAQDVCDYAAKFLVRPYVLGTKGPKTFDCSGFTSYVFRNFDINLSPSSKMQYTQGRGIDVTEVRPGDLLFFTSPRNRKGVGHVGMAVKVEDGNITFIHASCKEGVKYNSYPSDDYYRRSFIGARRVID